MNFLIKTLGCRVNQAESREIAGGLKSRGWREAEPPELVILNTCCVTVKAEKETRQTARALKRKYPKSLLIVTGCAVDYWKMKGKLPDLETDLFLENKRKMAIAFHLRGGTGRTPRVFIKIQDGCNRFCSYCIVPYLRGRSRSKKPEGIIKEIEKLEKAGTKEVILCGINLADYKPSLAFLLKKVLKETKIPRIRLGSINLSVFRNDFISLWSDSRLCPHFHIPLQSGCNQTLERMKRGYTFEEYKKVVEALLQRITGVNITTDFMVGFPEETGEEFEESLENLKSLRLGKIHVFRYSKREGTRAAEMENQVPESVKKERAEKIRELGRRMGEEFAKKFIGKKLRVLFEQEKEGFFGGLSGNYIRVRAKGKSLMDKIKEVKIKVQKPGVLYGTS